MTHTHQLTGMTCGSCQGKVKTSIIGVLQSVLNKTKIQCACLGSVFKLPMSSVTMFEDGLMIVMSIATQLIM